MIVAAHNAEATLANALNSLLEQSFRDWEAIVVDDASSDQTQSVAEPFLRDQRFSYIRLTHNSGSGTARNIAIQRARGEYLAILDADDRCTPNRLIDQVLAFERSPEVVVVGGQVIEIDARGRTRHASWPTSSAEIQRQLANFKMPIAHCAAMFRAEAVRNVGGYPAFARRAQDFGLLLRLADFPMIAVPSTVLYYRRDRPTPLRYIVRSNRYARAVRRTHQLPSRENERIGLPGSALVDLRSLVSWAKEIVAYSPRK